MSKAKKKEPTQWSVPMRLEFNVTVTVEAASEEEARTKANAAPVRRGVRRDE